MYLGEAVCVALYGLASRPALYARIRGEADALFGNGDPVGRDFTPSAVDVAHRFISETLRMYPIVPMSIRTVMNACVVEGHALPAGSEIFLARTAPHYMEDVFPDPFTFDIDRFADPRNNISVPGTRPTGSARTGAWVSGGWN